MVLDDYLHLAHRAYRRSAKRFCPRLHGRIVDVGCGRQPYRPFLTGATEYVGLESNPDLDPDVLGDIHDIPFGAREFDGALCTEVLEHVPDPPRAVAELNRVLRPGALLYVTVPMTWGLHYEPHDYYRYTRYGIRHVLESGGFRVLETDRIGGLFSYFGVRLIDMLVARVVFPICDRFRLRRGRWRLAALLMLPLNVVFMPLAWLDRFDELNPIGWAVLAEKVPTGPTDEN